MRFDEIHLATQRKRKGFARRFILSLVWLAITIYIARYVTNWLLDTGRLTYSQIIANLQLPASVTTDMIHIGIIVLIVIVIQFITLLLVAIISPSGRTRPGDPTLKTRDLDVDPKKYYRQ